MVNSTPASAPSFLQNPAVRQFVKFCIVGASNVGLDVGVWWVLTYHFGVIWWVAKVCSFIVAVSNSFYWNSRWTFRALDYSRRQQQFVLFVSINLIGLLLNLFIMKGVFWAMTGTLVGQHPTKLMGACATLVATTIVVFWNFLANRHWTFKQS